MGSGPPKELEVVVTALPIAPGSSSLPSRAITVLAIVLSAAAIAAGVFRTLAAHTVTHRATCAANAFVSWPARLLDRFAFNPCS